MLLYTDTKYIHTFQLNNIVIWNLETILKSPFHQSFNIINNIQIIKKKKEKTKFYESQNRFLIDIKHGNFCKSET